MQFQTGVAPPPSAPPKSLAVSGMVSNGNVPQTPPALAGDDDIDFGELEKVFDGLAKTSTGASAANSTNTSTAAHQLQPQVISAAVANTTKNGTATTMPVANNVPLRRAASQPVSAGLEELSVVLQSQVHTDTSRSVYLDSGDEAETAGARIGSVSNAVRGSLANDNVRDELCDFDDLDMEMLQAAEEHVAAKTSARSSSRSMGYSHASSQRSQSASDGLASQPTNANATTAPPASALHMGVHSAGAQIRIPTSVRELLSSSPGTETLLPIVTSGCRGFRIEQNVYKMTVSVRENDSDHVVHLDDKLLQVFFGCPADICKQLVDYTGTDLAQLQTKREYKRKLAAVQEHFGRFSGFAMLHVNAQGIVVIKQMQPMPVNAAHVGGTAGAKHGRSSDSSFGSSVSPQVSGPAKSADISVLGSLTPASQNGPPEQRRASGDGPASGDLEIKRNQKMQSSAQHRSVVQDDNDVELIIDD
jgi:hypothetical protein